MDNRKRIDLLLQTALMQYELNHYKKGKNNLSLNRKAYAQLV